MSTLTIKKLPANVIRQIAAGQVVENPASIVKELVENALDARATEISVNLQIGGTAEIRVIDSGAGIPKNQLLAAVDQHATSKIASLSDLNLVASFGFRGEALASIGAVSQLVLQSRVPGSAGGYSVEVANGQVSGPKPVGMPPGTQVIVTQLFDQVPARKKFLKSPAQELRGCVRIITQFALMHPDIKFKLQHNGEVLVQTIANQTLRQRVEQLLGADWQRTIDLDIQLSHGSVVGLLGTPQLADTSRRKQYLFVNGRPVDFPELSDTAKQALGTLLEKRAHPAVVLQVSLPAGTVDANVHPQKRTVAIMHQQELLKEFATELEKVITAAELRYQDVLATASVSFQFEDPGMLTNLASQLKQGTKAWQPRPLSLLPNTSILQIQDLYLVAPTDQGLVLIDQHAAHERILYEQFKAELHIQQKTATIHTLEQPVTIPLSSEEQLLVESVAEQLQTMGFGFSLSESELEITQVPQVHASHDLTVLFAEFLADLSESKDLPALDHQSHKTIAYLACRTAIKAGDPLTPEERTQLVEQLFKTPNQYTCPHGRPTHVELSMGQLSHLFQRS